MKIIKFQAENIKKLRAVEITPDGTLVEIVGPNGSGKSSVLDAIFYALSGAADIPRQIVRQGEERAYVKLNLGNISVQRHFVAGGSTRLIVESADGARFPSPQAMLDNLIGTLTFDPLAFVNMLPKQQLETLQRVCKLDLGKFDTIIENVSVSRQTRKRDIARLEAQFAGITVPAVDTPDEHVNLADLVEKLDAAGTSNTKRLLEIRVRTATGDSIIQMRENAAEKRRQATELIRQADYDENLANQTESKQASLLPVPDAINTAVMVLEINKANQTNAQVEFKRRRKELRERITTIESEIIKETAEIEQATADRRATIAATVMPVEGLSFSDAEVLYNGLPLVNASSAEQLTVSVALAMAANPKLRILRVKDGSLLDQASLQQLTRLAAAADYQVWIERVDETQGRTCIVMEDGAVKEGGFLIKPEDAAVLEERLQEPRS